MVIVLDAETIIQMSPVDHSHSYLIFYKNSSIKLPKKQKKQVQIRMWSYDRTDTHTHASNDSYEHPPR